jgi:FO synthase subunit 2
MQNSIPQDVAERARAGVATREDALQLLRQSPFDLFAFADELRREAVGDTVTYIVNRNINFTDRCIGNCGFCAFHDRENYFLGINDILEKTGEAKAAGATEVCIQGGLLEAPDMDYYLETLRSIKARYPDIHIHAYSPMEVYHLAGKNDLKVEETLKLLRDNGLDTMPGTAAEILADRVRRIICPSKLPTRKWKEVVSSAHKAGIRTTATIMYGHVETWEERIDHILIVRDVQQQTGGITEFVPLPFMPYNNPIGREMIKNGQYATGGLEDLRLYAIARILLHTHVPNIQASWVKLGKKLAQVALNCGANDLGGTLMEEKISRSAGATTGESMPVEELKWLINTAGRVPVQRNTYYEPIGSTV